MRIKKIASFNVKEGVKSVRYSDLNSGIQYLPADGIINIKSEKVRIAGFGVNESSLYKIDVNGTPYSIGSANSIYLSNAGIITSRSIGGSKGTLSWAMAISDKFGVTVDGTLYAMGGHFAGTIEAKSGKIGTTLINEDGSIVSANGGFRLDANGDLTISHVGGSQLVQDAQTALSTANTAVANAKTAQTAANNANTNAENQKYYRIIECASYSNDYPGTGMWLKINNVQQTLNNQSRGLNVASINPITLAVEGTWGFDTFAGGDNITNFNSKIAELNGGDHIIVVMSYDASYPSRVADALRSIGGTVYTPGSSYRESYVLIGKSNLGYGNGVERYNPAPASNKWQAIASCRVSENGTLMSSNSGSLASYTKVELDEINNKATATDLLVSNWCNLNDKTLIDGSKIYTGTITADKISANAITADKISANAITAEKISANAITAEKISANAITADKISANAITADKIRANAITADKITTKDIVGTNGRINLRTGTFDYGNGKFKWDGSSLTINGNGTFSGNISANTGKIADYTINGAKLVGNNVGLSGTAGQGWAFWAGSNDADSAPFRVGHEGYLVASNANISGNISATSGKIASFTIRGNYLESSDEEVGISAGYTSFWAGYNGNDGSYKFKVTKDGYMYASNAEITGTISGSTITGGTISGATISGVTISGATLTGDDTWFDKLNAQAIQTNSDWKTNSLGYNIWTGGIKCSNIFGQAGTSNIDLSNEQVHIYTHYNSNILLSPSYARIQASNGPYVCCDGNGVSLYGNANNLQVHADNKIWVKEYDGGTMNTGTVVFSRNGDHTVSFYWGNDTGGWHLQTYVDNTYVGNAV